MLKWDNKLLEKTEYIWYAFFKSHMKNNISIDSLKGNIEMTDKIEKDKSVGERLLALRNKNGLTQEDLAERLDVSRQSISKWELNKTLPDVEKLIQLSEIYQVSMDFLIKGKEENSDREIQNIKMEKQERKPAEEMEQAAGEEKEEDKVKAVGWNMEHTVKQFVLLVCIFLSGLFCLCMFFAAGRFLFSNTFQKEKKEQNIICVEKIYEQYTKAQISMWSEKNESFLKEVVWLDIPGVRENDYVFCYLDEEKPHKVFFEYYSKTLLLPIIAGIVFLIFFIVFWMELRDLVKRNYNRK